MINPISSAGSRVIVFMAVLVLLFIAVWGWHIARHKTQGFLAGMSVALIVFLIIQGAGYLGLSSDGLVLTVLCIAIAGMIFFPVFANLERVTIGLAVIATGMLAANYFLKDDITSYLQVRAHNGYERLNIYKWAVGDKTDWNEIFRKFPDRPLIMEGVSLYFGSVAVHEGSENEVYRNIAFRDAVFTAWSRYNMTHEDSISFASTAKIGQDGIAQGDILMYRKVAFKHEFLSWWLTLASNDATQAKEILKFFEGIERSYEYNPADDYYTDEEFGKKLPAYEILCGSIPKGESIAATIKRIQVKAGTKAAEM